MALTPPAPGTDRITLPQPLSKIPLPRAETITPRPRREYGREQACAQAVLRQRRNRPGLLPCSADLSGI